MVARRARASLLVAFAAALALTACGGARPAAPPPPKPGAARAVPGGPHADGARADAPAMAAPPYTVEQLREATLAGRTYVFAVESEGAAPKRRTMRFVGADATGALLEAETSNPDGTDVVADAASHVTWAEMRDHAAFPLARVTRSEGHVTTRLGTFDCIVYAVRGDEGETTTFYFARSLPGPPVLFSTEKGGKIVKKSEVVEYRPGGAAGVAASGTAKVVSLQVAMKLEGDVDDKALVAALQAQLAPLDACVKPLPRGDGGVGSLNVRITLTGRGPVTVGLESPVPPDVESCLARVFAGWSVANAGAGKAMLLLELKGG